MTAIELIEIIQHRLAGGDMTPDLKSKYHPEIIRKEIAIIANSVLFDIFRNNDRGQEALDLYAKQYSVTLQYSSAYDLRYFELPETVVQLPQNGFIRSITAKKDQSYFIPMVDSRAHGTWGNLEVNDIDSKPYAFLTDENVYFYNISDDLTSLLVKLIIPFDKFADTDNVYLPSGKADQIADLVYNKLIGLPPEDLRNDNNSERP